MMVLATVRCENGEVQWINGVEIQTNGEMNVWKDEKIKVIVTLGKRANLIDAQDSTRKHPKLFLDYLTGVSVSLERKSQRIIFEIYANGRTGSFQDCLVFIENCKNFKTEEGLVVYDFDSLKIVQLEKKQTIEVEGKQFKYELQFERTDEDETKKEIPTIKSIFTEVVK